MGWFNSEPEQSAESDAEEKERLWEQARTELWPQYFHRGKILESWSAMIDGGKGRDDDFTRNLIRRVNEVNIPDMQVEVRTMYFDLKKEQGQVFVLLWRDVSPLYVCKMFIGTQEIGENLSITWYLLWDGNTWAEYNSDTAGKMLYDIIFNVGNEQALKDWMKIVHLVILDEVKQLMSGLNVDFSKVDVHTRGFLNLP